MASSNYDCSITQGYNFEKDSQELVGHLVSISIGGTALTADQTLTVPTDYSTTKVVGVISNISWEGGYAHPVYITCNVSTENQKALATMTHTNLSKTDVVYAFNVYAFDPVNKAFYLAFHTNGSTLNGLVHKTAGNLHLAISTHADPEVPSPLNYPLQIGIMPQDQAQEIQMAFSTTDKLVKTWGVAVQGS